MQSALHKIQLYAELVKFEHTIFALPFALSALLLATPNQWPTVATVAWVVLAMVSGRTYAMGLNRIIDCRIDAGNPRTAGRTLPAGRMKTVEAWMLTIMALVLMVFATIQLPPLCLKLLPIALLLLTGYSYVKRFSNLAHLVLGLALGSSAIGGWVATTGTLEWPAICFGLAVTLWVAGFDILYATQDVDYDQSVGLLSIPASLGIERALMLSRVFHALTVVFLILAGLQISTIGPFYIVAVLMSAGMLWYEQSLVKANDLSRINEAFFQVNGIMSVGFFLCVLADKFLGVRIWP